MLRFLVYLYYRLKPKRYFSMLNRTGLKMFWVNVPEKRWGEVEIKDVQKKHWLTRKVTNVKKAIYDVDSIIFYAINSSNAERKAKKYINQFS